MRKSLARYAPAALLTGTIIGAGIFALPAAAARAGYMTALVWLTVLAGVMWLLHRMFGEVVVQTEKTHRLPGYVGHYLGQKTEKLSLLSAILGGTGGLLIYIVLLEQFLSQLFPILTGLGGYIVWTVLSLLVLLGIKTVARAELFMAVFVVLIVLILSLFALPHMTSEHLMLPGPEPLLPFGILLFALGGFAAVPEMRSLFSRDEEKGYSRAITLGLFVPVVVYAVFMTAFVGAFGPDIGDDLTQTVSLLGAFPAMLLSVFGVLAVSTSFLVIGSYLVSSLHYDLTVPRRYAVLILLVPLFFYVAGIRQFIPLVAVIGTLLGGIDGILIMLTWRKMRQQQGPSDTLRVRLPRAVFWPLLLFFGAGAAMSLLGQFL